MNQGIDWNMLIILSPLLTMLVCFTVVVIVVILKGGNGPSERERIIKNALEQYLEAVKTESGDKGGAQQ